MFGKKLRRFQFVDRGSRMEFIVFFALHLQLCSSLSILPFGSHNLKLFHSRHWLNSESSDDQMYAPVSNWVSRLTSLSVFMLLLFVLQFRPSMLAKLLFFFPNFGPNSTTFIVPAEIFPARLRSTSHGISAAAGKLGAIVESFGFLYLAQSKDPRKVDHGYTPGIGVRNSLFLLAGCNLLGLLFTFLIPESNGRSLEDISGENDDDKENGVAV